MNTLTQHEKDLVKNALWFVYDSKLAAIAANTKIMSEAERAEALKTANEFFDLTEKFE